MAAPRPRPDPLRWLWYAYGGRLPGRFAPWVLYDATARTWILRHAVRVVVQIAPFVVAIVVFVPGPLWLRATSALGGAIMGAIFAMAYIDETADYRLVKAGYAPGTATAVRAEYSRERDAAARAAARRRNPAPGPERPPRS